MHSLQRDMVASEQAHGSGSRRVVQFGTLLGHGLLASMLIMPLVGCEEEFDSTTAGIFTPADGPFPREGLCNIDDPMFDNVRHTIHPDQNIGPDTLKGKPIPEPDTINDYIASRPAAIALGKALFWDMQVGADGIQACGSCHFRAGADPRSRNQLAPGGLADTTGNIDIRGPNTQLTPDDFPLYAVVDRFDRTSEVVRNVDDVVSSQGEIFTEFTGNRPGASRDRGRVIPDPVHNINGVNTRRVEQRNTPTMINAVFNHRNFWDGRADNIFNGVNPFGARDPDARVMRRTYGGGAELIQIRLNNASLASQAVGPPESNFEMSFDGRTFRNIGRRLVRARPLRKQRVHPYDSVLAGMIHRSGKGLRGRYAQMIREAFKRKWWKSNQIAVIADDGSVTLAPKRRGHRADNEFSMMEYNFSLFFGLAVQVYESTLVSDDAKIDQHFDSLAAGGNGVLNAQEERGMELFEAAGCSDCHSGAEFTGASVRTELTGFDNPNAVPFPNGSTFQPPEQIERMVIGSCEVAVYDQGFYNLGVRPFEEDPGISATDPFGNPLSIAKLKTMDPASIPSQELLGIRYPELGEIGVVPFIEVGERVAVEGAFKIPGLRNVELTAPYFHNGGKLTLRQVVEFYNRGGDFHDHVSADGVAQDDFMDLVIGRLELTDNEIDDIVAFLKTLTDDRVKYEAAPFDHPALRVPNGHIGDEHWVQGRKKARTQFLRVPAVGRYGHEATPGFLEN